VNAVPGQAHLRVIAQPGQSQHRIARMAVLQELHAQPGVLHQQLARPGQQTNNMLSEKSGVTQPVRE